MNERRITLWPLNVALIIIVLVYAQNIILPFIFALLIWFVIKHTRGLIDKIGFIKKYIPRWIKTILAAVVVFGFVVFTVQILIINIQHLSHSYNKYGENIITITNKLNSTFNIDVSKEINHFVNEFDVTLYLESIFNSLSDILGDMVLIIFYVMFLFFEEALFRNKISLIFTDENKLNNVKGTLRKIDKTLARYIILKSLLNLLIAVLSFIVLLSVGIDSPIFWAFLIFVLNFIPSVGAILGSVLPFLFALIQFGEFIPAIVILLGTGSLSMLVGSLVDPKVMGNTLNISPLVAILSLAIWGSIWGVTGMLLSVPITVAMIIVLSQFPKTKPLAILLSEKGKVSLL